MATIEERTKKAKELIYATKKEVPPPLPRSVEGYRLKAIEVFKRKLPRVYDVFCDVKTNRLPAPETGTVWTWMKEYMDSIMIRTRLLRGIRDPKTEATFLGWKLNLPIMPAPLGDTICALHPDAYKFILKAGNKVGVINWLGWPMREEIVGSLPKLVKMSKTKVVWIIKPHPDIEKIIEYIKRAEEAGVSAVGCDIDAGPSVKMGEIEFPFGAWPHTSDEYRRIRNATELPFILKGVTSVEDAHKAVEIGADAIVVSIHGGYGAVDYGVPPMMALREIADVVGDRIEIIVDGQIRRGTHILKALALGARNVLIGRPIIWALAVGQTNAIVHVFEILTRELVRAMKYAGVEDVRCVPQDTVILPPFFPVPSAAPFL